MRPFVTLGDLIADLQLGLEGFPIQPGQHQTVSSLILGPGGAGNALVAAARLGLPAAALGSLGGDWVGAQVLAHLRAEGVDVSAVVQAPDAVTTTAVILRAAAGERVFLGRPGARGPAAVPAAWGPVLQTAGVLLVNGWTWQHDQPEMAAAGAGMAAAAGVPVYFDPGPPAAEADPAWLRAMIDRTDVLLATEAEAGQLAARLGAASPEVLVTPRRTLVIKRGAAGCRIGTPAGWSECPGYPVPAADPTAAGDCFAAAAAWGRLNGLTWEQVGAVANAAGAAKVQKIGTALAAPTRAEISAVLRRFRPELAGLLDDEGPARTRRGLRCEG